MSIQCQNEGVVETIVLREQRVVESGMGHAADTWLGLSKHERALRSLEHEIEFSYPTRGMVIQPEIPRMVYLGNGDLVHTAQTHPFSSVRQFARKPN